MKRLYIGGLSHTITQKDLRDRFGKFGDVQDVELRTRRDDEGVPYKTFGYINLEITDDGFKKCMTVLNKSKWKGGTIQIEQAKESFLQKLAQERHEAAENSQSPSSHHKDKLVESLERAGVENFHMKAAVPGTEVPGHKDWVVSKFGRVLPILNLKCQGRNKLIKYDPSKHSHNIKKLETAAEGTDLTPVSQLTWEISGGDDEISKKRRGEFPPQKARPAKKRKDTPASAVINRPSETGLKVFTTPADTLEVEDDDDNLEVVGDDYIPKTFLVTRQPTKNVCHLPLSLSKKDEEDYDSADTDEILSSRKTGSTSKQDKLPEADVQSCPAQTNNIKETDTVKAKADRVVNKKLVKKVFTENNSPPSESDNDNSKDFSKAKKIGKVIPKMKSVEKGLAKKKFATPSESDDDASENVVYSKAKEPVKYALSEKSSSPPSSSDDENESDENDSEASADSEYKAMFTNCQRLEFSLDDLQQLVKESFLKGLDQDSDDEDRDSDSKPPGASQGSEESSIEPLITSAKAPLPLVKTGMGITPEEILAAILEEDSSDEEKKRKKKKGKKKAMNTSTALPAFQGTKALGATSTSSQNAGQDVGLKQPIEAEDKINASTKKLICDTKILSKSSASVILSGPSTSRDVAETVPKPSRSEDLNPPSSSLGSEETTESPARKQKNTSKEEKRVDPPAPSTTTNTKWSVAAENSTSSSNGFSSEESDSSVEEEEDGSEMAVPGASQSIPAQGKTDVPKKPISAVGPVDAKQQLQDNQRRLSALEQRQREAELQNKLIQDALAKVDALTAGKGKQHIKFSSDEEGSDDDDDDEPSSPIPLTPKKTLFQDSQSDEEDLPATQQDGINDKRSEKLAGSKLFDSDDGEDEEAEEEGKRFHIKPQFEGKAGAKLMQLQSRFGTDERFQLDSRFIDSADEDDVPEKEAVQPEPECELSEEKRRSLGILSDLLHINIQPSDPNKPTAKVKTFRDISALQYDPTKQEHASFETKNDQPKKESKLARKKKREEAEKLPEVSKEIYYDVTVDLKEVFGATRDEKTEEVKNLAWDEEEEQKEEELSHAMEVDPVKESSLLSTNEGEASSSFKFSFFGDDTQAETTTEKEEYQVQMLKGPKLSWQADPRFRDSSDDEEEEEEEEKSKPQTSIATPAGEPAASKKAFFFFQLEDVRLKEGPKAFYRSAKLEDQREMWKEKRTGLVEEYRKKHKDARRKLKTSKRN
ncbi:nucleolar protein 8 [Esox lucius]|uniref:Nucleolar protein 8 n=1 Tax=Esox lucius TaxID=8010 RepID=A0A3P9A4Y3_ESOLU|nr:nucleolar protein 8 [Esox lucius]XP_028981708.2 nucleolar protein 8 [Esox lucius]XP_028981709.2 nucleolar protein 8 [Esox lucius]